MVPCRLLPTTKTKFVWATYRRVMTAKGKTFSAVTFDASKRLDEPK